MAVTVNITPYPDIYDEYYEKNGKNCFRRYVVSYTVDAATKIANVKIQFYIDRIDQYATTYNDYAHAHIKINDSDDYSESLEGIRFKGQTGETGILVCERTINLNFTSDGSCQFKVRFYTSVDSGSTLQDNLVIDQTRIFNLQNINTHVHSAPIIEDPKYTGYDDDLNIDFTHGKITSGGCINSVIEKYTSIFLNKAIIISKLDSVNGSPKPNETEDGKFSSVLKNYGFGLYYARTYATNSHDKTGQSNLVAFSIEPNSIESFSNLKIISNPPDCTTSSKFTCQIPKINNATNQKMYCRIYAILKRNEKEYLINDTGNLIESFNVIENPDTYTTKIEYIYDDSNIEYKINFNNFIENDVLYFYARAEISYTKQTSPSLQTLLDNPENLIKSDEITITSDQAKIYIKNSNANFVKGKLWFRSSTEDSWHKVKNIYIKDNNAWKRQKN